MPEPIWSPATEEQLRSMYEDLGASKETIDRDVATLREWISKQPHFPKVEDNANPWLANYLIRCKNSMERTKESLDYLFAGRNAMPQFFLKRDPMSQEIQESFDQVHIATMPTLTPDGERVHVYAYPENADAALFDVQALFKRVLMKAELVMRDDLARAEIVIVDLKHGSPSRLAQFTSYAALLKRFANDSLKMYPARMKQFHLINAPPFTAMILNLFSYVLKDKLFKRIIVHPPGVDHLKEYIPEESIPKDYGGKGPSIAESNEKWRLFLKDNREWFRTLENLKTDESKRLHESKRAILSDEILGCQGSFRRLAVD